MTIVVHRECALTEMSCHKLFFCAVLLGSGLARELSPLALAVLDGPMEILERVLAARSDPMRRVSVSSRAGLVARSRLAYLARCLVHALHSRRCKQ